MLYQILFKKQKHKFNNNDFFHYFFCPFRNFYVESKQNQII